MYFHKVIWTSILTTSFGENMSLTLVYSSHTDCKVFFRHLLALFCLTSISGALGWRYRRSYIHITSNLSFEWTVSGWHYHLQSFWKWADFPGAPHSSAGFLPECIRASDTESPIRLKQMQIFQWEGGFSGSSSWQLPGEASCLYDEVTNTVTVVDSHWLPAQTGLYVVEYQPVPRGPRSSAGGSSLAAASQVGTWKWNPGVDLWTLDASWSSACAPLVWPRGVSRHPGSWAMPGQVEAGVGTLLDKVFTLKAEED